jgi:predicted HD phosphohydrolase
MNDSEAMDFEKEEWFNLYITLREWDEKAKEENISLPDLDRYRALMIQHLSQSKNFINEH